GGTEADVEIRVVEEGPSERYSGQHGRRSRKVDLKVEELLCVQRRSGLSVQRAAPGRRAGDSGVERRQRVTEGLGRPYLQSKQNDDGGMTVVRLIDLAHEDFEECALVRLHVLEHRVLVGGRKILERRP